MFVKLRRRFPWLGKLVRFAIKWMKFVVAVPVVVPALVVLYAIEPFHRVRVCHIGSVVRIGWLALIPDHYLRLWDRKGKPQSTSMIFLMHSADNQPLMDMYKRLITVCESKAMDWIIGAARPMLEHTRFLDDGWREDHYNPHNSKYFGYKSFLTFTPEEELRGQEILRSMGIGPDDWFICFHAREPAYYDTIKVSTFEKRVHSPRNCNPLNYLRAAELAVDRGGFAIRMGKGVVTRLPEDCSERIIDFAYDNYDPFADIYLAAKCKFFLGNTAGIICVPAVMGVPAPIANQMPPSSTSIGPKDPWIPMLVRHIPSDRLLTFNEIWDLGLFDTGVTSESLVETLEQANCEWVENTADEIADICLDTFDMIDGVEPSSEGRELQEYFRSHFHSHLPDWEHFPLMSARFAMRHAKLIKPDSNETKESR